MNQDIKMLIESDENYIGLKRFDYNINKALERYPSGAPNHIISGALMIPEDQIDFVYNGIVEKLRILMGVKLD